MKNYRIEAAIIAAGIAISGIFLWLGLKSATEQERVVSVRGLAEREVAADHVTWPIVYKTTGNDPQALYADINTANAKIKQFLIKNGIKEADISTAAPQITDRWANDYNTDTRERYNITSIITVASKDVEKVRQLMPRMGELLKEGVAISEGGYGTSVTFEFNGLNDIKPSMIEEATKNARLAAEKFASDSGSELGKIKSASQGYFDISDRDSYTPHIKVVRVVTSVDYFLES